ncbi:hypothetical protein ACQ4PT_038377 [Festuca glaucescens]
MQLQAALEPAATATLQAAETPATAASGPAACGGLEVVPDRVKEGSSTTIPTPSPRSSPPPSTVVQPHAFTDRDPSSMAGEALFSIHDTAAQALFLLFLVPLVILLIGRKRWSRRKSKQQLNLPLPPSPPGKFPVIGHLHLVGSLPHVSFRDLAQKHGRDLMLLRLGAVNTVVVSSPRAAEAVLRTPDHALASRPRSNMADIILYGSSDVGFAPYGDPWRQARKVVTTHMLNAKKVHSFRHDREEEVRITVAKIRASATAASAGTVPATAVDMSEHLDS